MFTEGGTVLSPGACPITARSLPSGSARKAESSSFHRERHSILPVWASNTARLVATPEVHGVSDARASESSLLKPSTPIDESSVVITDRSDARRITVDAAGGASCPTDLPEFSAITDASMLAVTFASWFAG